MYLSDNNDGGILPFLISSSSDKSSVTTESHSLVDASASTVVFWKSDRPASRELAPFFSCLGCCGFFYSVNHSENPIQQTTVIETDRFVSGWDAQGESPLRERARTGHFDENIIYSP
jgi:hypothetical protein